MSHDEMIAVIQAAKEGKVIESALNNGFGMNWSEDSEHQKDGFDFQTYIYRIKPEPRSLWVVRNQSGNLIISHETKDAALFASASISKATIHQYKEVLP